jgi:hypothetical protein
VLTSFVQETLAFRSVAVALLVADTVELALPLALAVFTVVTHSDFVKKLVAEAPGASALGYPANEPPNIGSDTVTLVNVQEPVFLTMIR